MHIHEKLQSLHQFYAVILLSDAGCNVQVNAGNERDALLTQNLWTCRHMATPLSYWQSHCCLLNTQSIALLSSSAINYQSCSLGTGFECSGGMGIHVQR